MKLEAHKVTELIGKIECLKNPTVQKDCILGLDNIKEINSLRLFSKKIKTRLPGILVVTT